MIYKVVLKKSVARDLKKIQKEQADTILKKIKHDLPEKAVTCPCLTGKFANLRKYRVGDYRIIFSIIGDTVIVLRISHRREVYR